MSYRDIIAGYQMREYIVNKLLNRKITMQTKSPHQQSITDKIGETFSKTQASLFQLKQKESKYLQREAPVQRAAVPKQTPLYQTIREEQLKGGKWQKHGKKRPLAAYYEGQDEFAAMPAPFYKSDFGVVQEDLNTPVGQSLVMSALKAISPISVRHDAPTLINHEEIHGQLPGALPQVDFSRLPPSKNPHLFTDTLTKGQEFEIQDKHQEEVELFQQTLSESKKKMNDISDAFGRLQSSAQEEKMAKLEENIQVTDYLYHPHLLFKDKIYNQSLGDVEIEAGDLEGGLLLDIKAAYLFQGGRFYIWIIENLQHSLVSQDLGQAILNVSLVESKKQNQPHHYLIVSTCTELHKYSVFHKSSNSISLEKTDDDILSNDGCNTTAVFQSSDGRIFIGGQAAQISELDPHSTSFFSKIVQGKSKMKKIDQTQTAIDKLMPSFFNMSQRQKKQVINIAQNARLNALFVAVHDFEAHFNSYVDVYDLGREGTKFQRVIRVRLGDIYASVEELQNIAATEQQKKALEILSISPIDDVNGQLLLTLSNGVRLQLLFSEQAITFQEYRGQQWLQTPTEAKFKPSFIDPTSPWCVSKIISSPVLSAFNAYDSLWDTQIFGDNKTIFKPLTSQLLDASAQITFQISYDYEIIKHHRVEKSKVEFFVVKTQQQWFVLCVCPSPILSPQESSQQSWASVVRLESDADVLDISTDIFNERLRLTIFTNYGIIRYMMPSQTDVLCSYLSLLNTGQHPGYEFIQHDFSSFLAQFNTLELLVLLLGIAIKPSQDQNFLVSNLVDHHYTNAPILMQNCQSQSEFNSQQQQLAANYLQEEHCSWKKGDPEMQQRAIEFIIQQTQSTSIQEIGLNPFETTSPHEKGGIGVLEDGHFETMQGENQLDMLRLKAIYIYMVRQIDHLLKLNLFRKGDEDETQNLVQNIPPDTIQKTSKLIENILSFVNKNKVVLQIQEDTDAQSTTGNTLPQQFDALQTLLERLIGGLQMLNELMNFPKIREIINKDLSKDQIRELESVNLQSFLQQGLEIFSICKLFEKFIGQINITGDESEGEVRRIQKCCEGFIPSNVISLFIARKCLSNAAQCQDRQMKSYLIGRGFDSLMQKPIKVNLNVAVSELLNLDLINQLIIFALKKASQIQLVIDHLNKQESEACQEVTEEQRSSWQQEMQDCFSVVIELLQQVYERIKELQAQRDPKKKQDRDLINKRPLSLFPGINNFRKRLQKIDDLINLSQVKERIIIEAIRCPFEIFHFTLYDYMASEGAYEDVFRLKTPFVENYIQQMNLKDYPTDQVPKQHASDTIQDVYIKRLEFKIKHFLSTKMYEQGFQEIFGAMADPDLKIDIKERIKWMQKASGFLEHISMGRRQTPSLIQQTTAFNKCKMVFYQINQVRDKIRKRGLKTKDLALQQELANIDTQLSYDLLTDQEVLEVAFAYQLWTLVLRIIDQNTDESNLTIVYTEEVQDQICQAYQGIIRDKYYTQMTIADFQRFQAKLWKLYKVYGQKGASLIQKFPLALIVQMIEEINKEYLSSIEEPDYINKEVQLEQDWHPFWMVEFALSRRLCSCHQLFSIYSSFLSLAESSQNKLQTLLSSQKSFLFGKADETEENHIGKLFATGYLMIRWADLPKDPLSVKQYTHKMNLVVAKLKHEFKDEFLFSKSHFEKVQRFISAVEEALTKLKSI